MAGWWMISKMPTIYDVLPFNYSDKSITANNSNARQHLCHQQRMMILVMMVMIITKKIFDRMISSN